MERVLGPLAAGTYTVKVQWAVVGGTGTFRLDDWAFVVERVVA
jgi:hypothetical protein